METNQIYHCLERLGELLKVGARRAGAAHGLQPIQLEVLHYLSICNRFSDTLMAVTEYLGQTKGTVSQTIKVLETKALIRKQADSNDKRISHLIVTDKGREIIRENIPTALFSAACKDLSKSQQKEVAGALQLLLNKLIESNKMKAFGVCRSCRHHCKNNDSSSFCGLVKEPLTRAEAELICREHELLV